MTSKERLIQMLSELSEDALAYVERPILGAYYYSDGRDAARLSNDDVYRFGLIVAAANGSEKLVRLFDMRRRSIDSIRPAVCSADGS